MKVLIAIEPRSYREAIGEVLRALRPHLIVTIVEPEDLSVELGRFGPELVFANRSDSVQAAERLGWVEFRPYEEPPAKIHLGGRWRELKEVDLPDLLSVVDEAEELARTSSDLQNS